MNLYLMTSAKGGIGKTFLTFLNFLSSYKSEDPDRKVIFIDYNFMNSDLLNIFKGLYSVSSGNIIDSSNNVRFEYSNLVDNKVLFIWNNDDHFFPNNGISGYIDSLSDICSSDAVKSFVGDQNENVDVFVDTNLHVKAFYSSQTQVNEEIKSSLRKLKNSISHLKVLFIWSYALFLGTRLTERISIKMAISNFSEIWNSSFSGSEVNNSLLLGADKELGERDEASKRDIHWSAMNFINVFNYYLPISQTGTLNWRRTNVDLESYRQIYQVPKCDKGVSFHQIDKIIFNIKKFFSVQDMNNIKMHVIAKLKDVITSKVNSKDVRRAKNVLVLPTFHRSLTGFTEQWAEISLTDEDERKKILKKHLKNVKIQEMIDEISSIREG